MDGKRYREQLDRARLAFAVRVANSDPTDEWSAADLEYFRKGLTLFLGSGRAGTRRVPERITATPPWPWEYGRDEFRTLREITRYTLNGIAAEGALRVVLPASAPEETTVEIGRLADTGAVAVSKVSGPVSTIYPLSLVFLLLRQAQHVRLCRCGSFFVRKGKMEHCTPTCRRKYYMRDYREDSSGRFERPRARKRLLH